MQHIVLKEIYEPSKTTYLDLHGSTLTNVIGKTEAQITEAYKAERTERKDRTTSLCYFVSPCYGQRIRLGGESACLA